MPPQLTAQPSSENCDMTQVSQVEAPPQANTRKMLSSLIYFGLFCWGVFGVLSIISKLDIVSDFSNWSVGQAPLTLKHVLLAIGAEISEVVSGYRAFVHNVARLLGLPPMPPVVYDVIGIITFSAGRGYRVGMPYMKMLREQLGMSYQLRQILERRKASKRYRFGAAEQAQLDAHHENNIMPFWLARRAVVFSNFINPLDESDTGIAIGDAIAATICYGALVSVVVTVLFGIDYCYRYFEAVS